MEIATNNNDDDEDVNNNDDVCLLLHCRIRETFNYNLAISIQYASDFTLIFVRSNKNLVSILGLIRRLVV